MRRTGFLFFVLFAAFIWAGEVFCPSGWGKTVFPDKYHKLTNQAEIEGRFEAGQEKIRITVNLSEPTELRGATKWDSRDSLKALQEEVKNRQSKVLQKLDKNKYKLRHLFDNQAGFSAEVSAETLERLLDDPDVESIEPVYELRPHLAQGIELINALEARLDYNGQGVSIAICDTGVDYTHPMLGGGAFPNSKVIGGYDFGDNDSNPFPAGNAHGTSCAGIAAGDLGESGDYIGGVAHNAKIYALKITEGTSGSAYTDDIAAAWNWCISHKNSDPANPILAISTSFGGDRFLSTCDSDTPSMTTAANNAVSAGIAVLVSAGNEGYCDALAHPSCISSVISVGAVYDAGIGRFPADGYVGCIEAESCVGYTANCPCSEKCYVDQTTAADQVATYSNTSEFLDLFAPSNNAYTTDIVGSGGYSSGNYHSGFGGTSAACPYAAGAAACLQSAAKAILGRYLTAGEVKDLLIQSGDPVTDPKAGVTKPRINLGKAINSFTGPPEASNVAVTTSPGVMLNVSLNAGDEGLPNPPAALTYIIKSLPEHGTLSDPCQSDIGQVDIPYSLTGHRNVVRYTPLFSCFTGTDSFTFAADDGGVEPEGGQSNTAVVTVNIDASAFVVYQTDFASGVPSGWSIVDGYSDGKTWTGDNPKNRVISGFSNGFMIADSDWAGNVDMDEQLISPIIDCTGLSDITLNFDHYFYWYWPGGDEKADVDIRVGQGPWQNMVRYLARSASGKVTLSLSSCGADGEPNVQLRWHYYDAKKDRYWGIDNVEITGVPNLVYPGDFESDCDVDMSDYSALASAWQSTPNDVNWNSLYDISEPTDNVIDTNDLFVLSSNWLYGKSK